MLKESIKNKIEGLSPYPFRKNSNEVVKILAKETKEKNKATIMVTHDTRLVKFCDRILEMKDGELTEKDISEANE